VRNRSHGSTEKRLDGVSSIYVALERSIMTTINASLTNTAMYQAELFTQASDQPQSTTVESIDMTLVAPSRDTTSVQLRADISDRLLPPSAGDTTVLPNSATAGDQASCVATCTAVGGGVGMGIAAMLKSTPANGVTIGGWAGSVVGGWFCPTDKATPEATPAAPDAGAPDASIDGGAAPPPAGGAVSDDEWIGGYELTDGAGLSSTGTDSSSNVDSSGTLSTDPSSGTSDDGTDSSTDGEAVSREPPSSGELPADSADSGAADPRIHDPGGRFLVTQLDPLESASLIASTATAALPGLSLLLRG
jgi:hypothetical protein